MAVKDREFSAKKQKEQNDALILAAFNSSEEYVRVRTFKTNTILNWYDFNPSYCARGTPLPLLRPNFTVCGFDLSSSPTPLPSLACPLVPPKTTHDQHQ